jgi:hypothetical protein
MWKPVEANDEIYDKLTKLYKMMNELDISFDPYTSIDGDIGYRVGLGTKDYIMESMDGGSVDLPSSSVVRVYKYE